MREVVLAKMLKAAMYVEPGRIVLDQRPVPDVGPVDATARVTATTICGTDVHLRQRVGDAIGAQSELMSDPPATP